MSKQEFIRASGRICARLDREIQAFIPLGTDPTTRRANREAIISLIRRENEDLHSLGHPIGASRAERNDLDGVYRSAGTALDRSAADERIDIEKEIEAALAPYQTTLGTYLPGCQ